MESRFGESFTGVRIHTGTQAGNAARALYSRAFTTHEDIVFAPGEYAPQTSAGLSLLAHELVHVIQQRRSRGTIGGENDAERDAHEASRQVMTGGTATVRQRVVPGTVQRLGERELHAEPMMMLGAPSFWTIEVDGAPDIVRLTGEADASNPPRAKAWETTDGVCYVEVSGFGFVHSYGRWKEVRLGRPSITMPAPPLPPKPKPAPPKPTPPKPNVVPPAQEAPEIVIGPSENVESAVVAQEPDRRPIAEQVVTALADNPIKAANLAPQLSDEEMEQFTPKDRLDLLDALTKNAPTSLDIQTVLRVLQTAAPSQQNQLLDGLVANDGKVLAALRASVRPEDRNSLENALFQLQLAADLRAGMAGANQNLFDPLGARGFTPVIFSGKAPLWAKNMQFRQEANGDWTMQAPGQPPLVVEGLLTRALRAQRQNEQILSFEARQLSPQGKVDRIKELGENLWTGSGNEDRIINMLRYTTADEAPAVLKGLKEAQSGGKPLLDKLDSAVDLDNNVEFHAQLASLRMRARKDDPNLLTDLAKAPMLPWRDAFFHNRAVFTVQRLSDGRIAVTYGPLQSFDLEASEAFGAAMRALPKEMQHGGTLILEPDDIVIVNDTDANRQVPLTAADLVAFQHSGNRGILKHMGNVAAVVVPVGLAARGTIGLVQAGVEVGGALLSMGADEYRMEIMKWSPGLMKAIDLANLAFAIRGGVGLAKFGASGVSTIYSLLKREYGAFKAARAAMTASGEASAIQAAKIAEVEAQSLLRELEQIQSSGQVQLPTPQGKVVVDLQSGPMVSSTGQPSFLTSVVEGTPGATGVGIEAGDYKLGYGGIQPAGPQDLNFSRMLVQNLPEWPVNTGQGPVLNWHEWQFDPNVAFPKSGRVVILQGNAAPGMTPVPEAFFPPVSKTGKVIPTNLSDVSGLTPTTHPELYGKVDQMFWRRPFGLGSADEATVAALGAEVDKVLKPGGFIEFRVLPSKDAGRALKVAQHIPGSRVVEIPQSAIKAYASSGIRPPNLSDEQWAILAAAGPDIRGQYGALGGGIFNRIVRIYKP
jgi:hypothetical protein